MAVSSCASASHVLHVRSSLGACHPTSGAFGRSATPPVTGYLSCRRVLLSSGLRARRRSDPKLSRDSVGQGRSRRDRSAEPGPIDIRSLVAPLLHGPCEDLYACTHRAANPIIDMCGRRPPSAHEHAGCRLPSAGTAGVRAHAAPALAHHAKAAGQTGPIGRCPVRRAARSPDRPGADSTAEQLAAVLDGRTPGGCAFTEISREKPSFSLGPGRDSAPTITRACLFVCGSCTCQQQHCRAALRAVGVAATFATLL
jgi:hypothetical protein